MKKITLLILFLTFISYSYAQNWNTLPNRDNFTPGFDIRIGIGCKPFEASKVAENLSNFGMDSWFPNPNLIDFDAKDYYEGARYTTNALFGEYNYQPNRWFGIGVTVTYFSYFSKYYDAYTDAQVGYNTISHFSIYPTVRFTWFRRPAFSMYTSFGFGTRMVLARDDLRYNLKDSGRFGIAGQFTLLGFTLGKQIYGFTDLSTIGTQGLITIGVGYRIVGINKFSHEKPTDFTR